MFISTRTPEGRPARCPICNTAVSVLPCEPLGDAPCPNCGTLLWPILLNATAYLIQAEIVSAELRREMLNLVHRCQTAPDSLARVELILQFEERVALAVPDDLTKTWSTLDDFLSWLQHLAAGGTR